MRSKSSEKQIEKGKRGEMSVRLANVLLLQRDVQKAITFYSKGLGLKLASESPKYAELTCSSGNMIALKQVEGEALCSTGYSPMLSFNVEDLQGTITRLITMGAHLDGPIRYPTFGKVTNMQKNVKKKREVEYLSDLLFSHFLSPSIPAGCCNEGSRRTHDKSL